MKRIMSIVSLCLAVVSCTSTQPGSGGGISLSEEKLQYVEGACFEVVAEKPAEESTVYDKPLNWDLVDFSIRNDHYVPLGTAFAISDSQLVTAAHVLAMTPGSQIYKTRFIREKANQGGKSASAVFEIDRILAFDVDRDYVVFTVKGRTFDKWLKISKTYNLNSKIFTAGDAYGEGIVVREGVLLAETAESEKGAWNYLKSSTATNPGNSGGPLLNKNGEVIGIALYRKDDFCYSLPMKEVAFDKGVIHRRTTFFFSIFDTRKVATLDRTIDVPLPYRELAERYDAAYHDFYLDSMNKLLAENSKDLFPEGSNSDRALYEYVGSVPPQIFLQDSTTKVWFSSDLKYETNSIEKNGYVKYAEIYKDANTWLLTLKRPSNVAVEELWHNPQKTMDLLLTGINSTRKLTETDQGSRILSYGKPIQSIEFNDRFGRLWQLNVFFVEYADQFVMTCATPTPQGLCMLFIQRESSDKDAWLYDMPKLADFVNISYLGTLQEWSSFLHQAKFHSGPLNRISVSYKEGAYVDIDSGSVSAHIGQGPIAISNDSELFIGYSVLLRKGKPVWDVRKLIIDTNQANSDNYCTIYRWPEPAKTLPDELQDQWKKFVLQRGHPYDGKPYAENGNMYVGIVHPDFLNDDKVTTRRGFVYTVAVGQEGTVAEETMQKRIKELAGGIQIKD